MNNKQLTSMSVPAQEESARVGQIEVDLDVTATLVGYTGPCVSGDVEEGPWDLGTDGETFAMGRRMQNEAAQKHGRLREEIMRSIGEPAVEVTEEFSLQAELGHILRQHPARLHVQSSERRDSHFMPNGADTASFRVASITEDLALQSRETEVGPKAALSDEISREEVRQLRDQDHERNQMCHKYVSIAASGIALGKGKRHSYEPHTSCERLSNRQCRVSFSCKACSLGREAARIALDVASGYVFTAAREIHWEIKTTWLHPDKGHSKKQKQHKSSPAPYSLVESIVTSGDLNKCLRGPDPSLIRINMVPTDFQDLLGASHLYGFVLQFIDAHIGSVTNPTQFHENLDQLSSIVELHASHSFYKLVLSKKSTAFDIMTQVLGFLSGMSLIARVTYAAWLTVDVRKRARSACLWTNPVVKCFSAILCWCVPVEEPEESERLSVILDLDAENGESSNHRKNPVQHLTNSKGDYHEVPQSFEGRQDII